MNQRSINLELQNYLLRFDLFLEYTNTCVIVEIENRRSDPITNVIKTIHWVDWSKKLPSNNIIFFHIFNTSHYKGSNDIENQVEYCRYIASRFPLIVKGKIKLRYKQYFIDFDKKTITTQDKKYGINGISYDKVILAGGKSGVDFLDYIIKKLPKLEMTLFKNLEEVENASLDDFKISGYECDPAIKASMVA